MKTLSFLLFLVTMVSVYEADLLDLPEEVSSLPALSYDIEQDESEEEEEVTV